MPEGTEREAKLRFQTEGADQLIGSLDRLIERLERVQSAVGGGAAAQPSTGYGSAAATQPAAVPAGGGLSLFQSQSAIPLQTGGLPSPQQQALQAQGQITTATPTSWRMTPGGVYAPPGYAPTPPMVPVQGALVPMAGGPPAVPQVPQAPGAEQAALSPGLAAIAYLAYRQTGILPAGLGYQYLHQAAIGAAAGYTINQMLAPQWQIEQAYATGQYVTPEAIGRARWGYAQPAGMLAGGALMAGAAALIATGVGAPVGAAMAVGAGLGTVAGGGMAGQYAGVQQADLSRQEQIRVLTEQMARQAGYGPSEAGRLRGLIYQAAAQTGGLRDDTALQAATADLTQGLTTLTAAAPQLATSPAMVQWAAQLQAGGPETFTRFAGEFGALLGRGESAATVQRMIERSGPAAVPELLTRLQAYAARGDVTSAKLILDAIVRLNNATRTEGTIVPPADVYTNYQIASGLGLPAPALARAVGFAPGQLRYEGAVTAGRQGLDLGTLARAELETHIPLLGAWAAYWGAEAEARRYEGAGFEGPAGRGYALEKQQADVVAYVQKLDALIAQNEGRTDVLGLQDLARWKRERATLAPTAGGYAIARAGVGYYGAMAQAGIAGAGAAVAARRTLGLPWAGALEERRGAELALAGTYEWFATQPGVPVEEAAQYRAMAAGQRAQAIATTFGAAEARRLAVEIPARAEYGVAGTRMGAAMARGEIWGPLFETLFSEMTAAIEKQIQAKKREIAEKVGAGAGELVTAPLRAELRGLEAQLPGIARQEFEMRYARLGIPVAAGRQIAGAAVQGLFGMGRAYGPALETGLGYQEQALGAQVGLAWQQWQDAVGQFGAGSEMAVRAQAQYAAVAAEWQGWPAQRIRTWQAGEQMIPGYQMGAGGAEAARARMAYGMLGALPAAREQIAGAYQVADVAKQALERARGTPGVGPQALAEFQAGWQQAQTQAAMTTLQALAPGLPAATEEAMAQADFQRAVLGMTWTSRGSLRQTVRQQMGASYQAVQDLVGQRDAAMREARTPEERIRLARTYNDSIRQAWMGVVSAEQQLEQGWQERIVSAFWGMPANANLALEEFNYAGAVTRGGAFGRHLGGTSAQTEYYRRQPLYGTSYAGAGLFNVPLTFMSSGLAGITQGMPWGAGTPDLGALANASLVGGAIEAHIHVHVHYPDGSETYHKVHQSVDVSNIFARRVPVQNGS